MEPWEKAVNRFLDEWRGRGDLTGALVCGSYVTGNPSPRSDIDIHIVLTEDTDWRMRGSKMVDGFLVEYFVNPPGQIRAYFEEDHRGNRRDAATQFATGRVVFDNDGAVAALKMEAVEWLAKEFDPLDDVVVELNKYGLWDVMDNLRDLHEKDSPSFRYAYYNGLRQLLGFYSRYVGCTVYSPERVVEMLTDQATRAKYLEEDFPDRVFAGLFVEAVTAEDGLLGRFEAVYGHVVSRLGGFRLDGWSLRTPVSG